MPHPAEVSISNRQRLESSDGLNAIPELHPVATSHSQASPHYRRSHPLQVLIHTGLNTLTNQPARLDLAQSPHHSKAAAASTSSHCKQPDPQPRLLIRAGLPALRDHGPPHVHCMHANSPLPRCCPCGQVPRLNQKARREPADDAALAPCMQRHGHSPRHAPGPPRISSHHLTNPRNRHAWPQRRGRSRASSQEMAAPHVRGHACTDGGGVWVGSASPVAIM